MFQREQQLQNTRHASGSSGMPYIRFDRAKSAELLPVCIFTESTADCFVLD